MALGVFFFLAALALIFGLGVVMQRNPVHSLLSLVMTLLVIAVIFIGLGATTVGLLQAIVYVGAIMVLFLFVIWMLNVQVEELDTGRLAFKFLGSVAAAALVAELLVFFSKAPSALKPPAVGPDYGSVNRLALALFSDYLIAFEVTSVLLLAAVVGAVALARRMPPAKRVVGPGN